MLARLSIAVGDYDLYLCGPVHTLPIAPPVDTPLKSEQLSVTFVRRTEMAIESASGEIRTRAPWFKR